MLTCDANIGRYQASTYRCWTSDSHIDFTAVAKIKAGQISALFPLIPRQTLTEVIHASALKMSCSAIKDKVSRKHSLNRKQAASDGRQPLYNLPEHLHGSLCVRWADNMYLQARWLQETLSAAQSRFTLQTGFETMTDLQNEDLSSSANP